MQKCVQNKEKVKSLIDFYKKRKKRVHAMLQ